MARLSAPASVARVCAAAARTSGRGRRAPAPSAAPQSPRATPSMANTTSAGAYDSASRAAASRPGSPISAALRASVAVARTSLSASAAVAALAARHAAAAMMGQSDGSGASLDAWLSTIGTSVDATTEPQASAAPPSAICASSSTPFSRSRMSSVSPALAHMAAKRGDAASAAAPSGEPPPQATAALIALTRAFAPPLEATSAANGEVSARSDCASALSPVLAIAASARSASAASSASPFSSSAHSNGAIPSASPSRKSPPREKCARTAFSASLSAHPRSSASVSSLVPARAHLRHAVRRSAQRRAAHAPASRLRHFASVRRKRRPGTGKNRLRRRPVCTQGLIPRLGGHHLVHCAAYHQLERAIASAARLGEGVERRRRRAPREERLHVGRARASCGRARDELRARPLHIR